MTLQTVDLTDVDAFARGEHHAMFRWLREHDPVHWHPLAAGGGFWALTRYDDISLAYLDNSAFLSSGGAMLGGSYRNETDTAAGRMLVSSDPPRHRLLRQQMHRAFSAQIIDQVARQVTILVDAAVERALADGGCDFATQIGPELPAGALMAMMGIGHADAHCLIGMTRRMIGFREGPHQEESEDARLRLASVQSEIFEFFYDLLDDRRRRPGEDLVSVLASAELNGRRLSDEDIIYNCMNVAVGGNETTSHTASSGVIALVEHPEQHQRLLDQPGLLDTAINEILRWSSTNAYVQRIASRDVEIGGRTIRAGDSVTVWNVSANRDPAQFRDPYSLDLSRSPNRHVSYGSGIHRCIGAALAQVELSILFGRLAGSRIWMEIDGQVKMVRSNFILGVDSLPVRMDR